MRALLHLSGSTAILLTLAIPARADDDADKAMTLVNEAIRAHGGMDSMLKTRSMVRVAKGELILFEQRTPFQDELALQLPKRWRWSLEQGSGAQRIRMVWVVNDEKGWQAIGGSVTEIPKLRMEEMQEEAYVLWITSLVPLKKEDGFQLALVEDATVNGKAAAGIKTSRKGHTDVTLYFDKESHLLVKTARRARESGLTFDKSYLYSGHKIFDGVMLPTKYVEMAKDKKMVEVTSLTYRFPEKLEDSTFAKP
jgi:hypothetical protein